MMQWQSAEIRRLAPGVASRVVPLSSPSKELEVAVASAAVLSASAPTSAPVDSIDGLVARARAGDGAAFGAIYERYARELYWHALRLTGSPDDADDMIQEAFARAFAALPGTTGKMNARAWLYRIVTNVCYDLLRQRARAAARCLPQEAAAAIPDRDPIGDPEEWVMRGEARSEVGRILDRMHDRSRALLLLRERDELSCAEIGERIGASRSAVKSGLFRARHEFQRLYDANSDAA